MTFSRRTLSLIISLTVRICWGRKYRDRPCQRVKRPWALGLPPTADHVLFVWTQFGDALYFEVADFVRLLRCFLCPGSLHSDREEGRGLPRLEVGFSFRWTLEKIEDDGGGSCVLGKTLDARLTSELLKSNGTFPDDHELFIQVSSLHAYSQGPGVPHIHVQILNCIP
ncbi:hypothetical protein QBC32DRAFT_352374 [Pseudoneurospora amorphoporcata]|uniref:Uncharacterized protein n=1 Tax=Pseudoneurospora amorphoporcata TaxID=241081 RepID=A0AAN6NN79_9PEZI|nr:hypothetical protein QBC32DRAFT_352374 [Pseudoneurospora amorphoporcata]